MTGLIAGMILAVWIAILGAIYLLENVQSILKEILKVLQGD